MGSGCRGAYGCGLVYEGIGGIGMTDLWIAFTGYSIGAVIGLIGMIIRKPGKLQGFLLMAFLFCAVKATGWGTYIYFR